MFLWWFLICFFATSKTFPKTNQKPFKIISTTSQSWPKHLPPNLPNIPPTPPNISPHKKPKFFFVGGSCMINYLQVLYASRWVQRNQTETCFQDMCMTDGFQWVPVDWRFLGLCMLLQSTWDVRTCSLENGHPFVVCQKPCYRHTVTFCRALYSSTQPCEGPRVFWPYRPYQKHLILLICFGAVWETNGVVGVWAIWGCFLGSCWVFWVLGKQAWHKQLKND